MEFLSVEFTNLGAEVDRQNKVLRGMVVAMEGDFVDGRGAFNREGLQQIANTINREPKGLKARWGHPSLLSDGLGRFLGRQKNAYVDSTINRQGKRVAATRANLHLDESSFKTPHGDLGGYLLDLAESDSDALSSSLVILPREEDRGRGLTPLWFPERLKSSDIVEEGAAVAGLLDNADVLRGKLKDILDRALEHSSRDDLEGFWEQYLTARFGEKPPPEPTPRLDSLRDKFAEMQKVKMTLDAAR